MPVVMLLLFGYVITNDIKDARISIFDRSKDEVTRKLTQKILSSGYFKLDKYIDNFDDIEKDFKRGFIRQVIIFDDRFAEKLGREGKANVQIISDASEPNTSNLLVNYNIGIISDFVRELNLSKLSTTNYQPSTNIQIIPEVRMVYNPELKSVFMFVPGLIGLLMVLISALMTAVSITREKEFGTMEVLLVSPLRPLQIIIGKVIPYIAIAFFDALSIIILSMLVFKIPVQGSIVLLLASTILYILVALSIGIFISTVTSSQQIAMMLSLVMLMLPSILLSGFIYPIENMPGMLQWLCQIMPPKWFIIIIKNIMIKGEGIQYIWKEALVLTGMMLFFILLSLRNFKIRLE
jgi:ABC-2 type transport system permease protein